MRRRADRHRGAIIDLQHRQTALVGPIGAEAKHAIGAIEARRGWSGRLAITLRPCVWASAAASDTAS